MTPERVIQALLHHPGLACQVVSGLQATLVLQPWTNGHQRERERHRIGSRQAIVQVRQTGTDLRWEVWHTAVSGMTRLTQGTYYSDIREAQRVADEWAVSQGWTLSEPLSS